MIKLSKSLDDNETYRVLYLGIKIIKVSFSTTDRIQASVTLRLFTYLFTYLIHTKALTKENHIKQLFIIIYNALTSSIILNYKKSFAEGDNASSNVFSLAPTLGVSTPMAVKSNEGRRRTGSLSGRARSLLLPIGPRSAGPHVAPWAPRCTDSFAWSSQASKLTSGSREVGCE